MTLRAELLARYPGHADQIEEALEFWAEYAVKAGNIMATEAAKGKVK